MLIVHFLGCCYTQKNPTLIFFHLILLQLAKNVGNTSFNDIMEGNLPSPSPKPSPSSDM